MAALSMTSGVALGSRAVAGRKVTARKAVISKPRAAVAVQASGDRKWNFSAGPAVLPLDVLEDCKEDLINYKGTGMSVMEMSHRGKDFMKIAEEAEADLRELVGIPDNYKVRPTARSTPHIQNTNSNPRYFHPPNRRRLPAAFARTRSNVSDRASPNHPSRSTHRFSSSRAARPPSSPPFP
jgi:hypothetical protein